MKGQNDPILGQLGPYTIPGPLSPYPIDPEWRMAPMDPELGHFDSSFFRVYSLTTFTPEGIDILSRLG